MKLAVWTVLLLLNFAVFTAAAGKTRVKRLVGIRPGSRFFLRMGFKDTIFRSPTFFAHAAGFKVSWEVQEGIAGFGKSRSIRALYDDVEFLFDRHGFDGKSCLLSNICQAAEYVNERSGAMAKILRLLLRYSSQGNDTALLDAFNCENHRSNCPLDFSGIDTYFG